MSYFFLESVFGFVETNKMNASLKLSGDVYPSIKPSVKDLNLFQKIKKNVSIHFMPRGYSILNALLTLASDRKNLFLLK